VFDVIRKFALKLRTVWILGFLVLTLVTHFVEALETEKNTVILEENNWSKGYSEGIIVTKDERLTLSTDADGSRNNGLFTSLAIEPGAEFTHLVPFWNATTPPGTKVVIRAKLKTEGEWSRWITVATWKEDEPFTHNNSSLRVASRIDTLKVKSRKGDKFKLCIELASENQNLAPKVRLFGATYWDSSQKTQAVGSTVTGYLKDLEVPTESQFEEPTSVAPLICSPTATSMVLQYYGERVKPREVAREVYDHGAKIYGNWAFNTAYAANHGLKAYVRYFKSLEGVKREIAADRPIIASIAFGKGELEGAPIESTSGHLVVVRGFLKESDQEYVIVNDPAARSDRSVRRTYRVDQFVSAWRGIGYVVKPLK